MTADVWQALEALRKLRTEKVQEAREMKLKLEHLRTHKDNADQLRSEVQDGQSKEQAIVAQIKSLQEQLDERNRVGLLPCWAAHQSVCNMIPTPSHCPLLTRVSDLVAWSGGSKFCGLRSCALPAGRPGANLASLWAG